MYKSDEIHVLLEMLVNLIYCSMAEFPMGI